MNNGTRWRERNLSDRWLKSGFKDITSSTSTKCTKSSGFQLFWFSFVIFPSDLFNFSNNNQLVALWALRFIRNTGDGRQTPRLFTLTNTTVIFIKDNSTLRILSVELSFKKEMNNKTRGAKSLKVHVWSPFFEANKYKCELLSPTHFLRWFSHNNRIIKTFRSALIMKHFSTEMEKRKDTKVSVSSRLYLDTQSKLKTEVIIRNQNYHEKESASLRKRWRM